MSVLNRKLGREILGNVVQLAPVVVIIAIGTSLFIGMGSGYRILEASRRAYYCDYRFADFWVDVKKAPLSAVEPIARMPGITDLETRVVFSVILDVPGEIEPLTGRLISTPADRFSKTLNALCLVRGSGFSDDRNEEVILGDAFALEHGLGPGDRIELILNRKRESFVIVGTAISPEYVYMVSGEGDFMPDPKHFGILYIKERYARDVLDFQDACNQIVGRVTAAQEADIELLMDRLARQLEPYGVLATTPRERQASHRFLSDEMRGLATSAVIMPSIFLLVAALVLNILMVRLVDRQRTVIGTLKAMGYSNTQVTLHYLAFGAAIGLVGGLLGNALGIGLAVLMVEVYKGFFHFPRFAYQVYPDLLLGGIAMSLAFAAGGTIKGVRRALRLDPAEAMRPKPPARGGAVFLERFPAIWNLFGFRTHMALRSLFRNRGRTLTAVFTSALATAIIFMALMMSDAMTFLMDYQFERIAHSDVDIGMREERSGAALYEARALPGVDAAEPVLGVRCDLRHGRLARRLSITGLTAAHRLTTPMQEDGTPIAIPPEGLVMSRKLAQVLNVRVGDSLLLTPVRGARATVPVGLASIVDSFVGLECYADLRYLSGLVGEAVAVNGVQLAVDPPETAALFRTIKELPNAQGLSVRANAKANLEETFLETMNYTLGIIIVFAGAIAFGSLLNTSLIEIGDRLRDISTLRALGYRPVQIAGVFSRQNAVIFVVGLILGYPIGYGLVVATATAYNTELFRMPVVVQASTVWVTAVLAFAFVLITELFVHRQIRRLDWAEGIKVKE